MKLNTYIFHNIKFFDCGYKETLQLLNKKKGYLVIPAASSLSTITYDKKYLNALQNSTIAIFDSGFFCICLFFFKFIKVKKFSGFKFIKKFLNDKTNYNKKILLIDPDKHEMFDNYNLLKFYKFRKIKNYVAPMYKYNKFYDLNLVKVIKKYKPDYIVINIGGGVQEKLALYIKKKLSYKGIIICSGAAISFFTKNQARITTLVDSLYLGWLMRLVHNPFLYFGRIIQSFNLLKIVFNSSVIKLNFYLK